MNQLCDGGGDVNDREEAGASPAPAHGVSCEVC